MQVQKQACDKHDPIFLSQVQEVVWWLLYDQGMQRKEDLYEMRFSYYDYSAVVSMIVSDSDICNPFVRLVY